MAAKGGKKKDEQSTSEAPREPVAKSPALQKAIALHEAGDVALARKQVKAWLAVPENAQSPDAEAARAYLSRSETPKVAIYFGIAVAVAALLLVFIASKQP